MTYSSPGLITFFTVNHFWHILVLVFLGMCTSLEHPDTLFIQVRGDEPSPVQEPELKYAAIGIGIGIFLSICFLAIKMYMIKRHILDNEQSQDSVRAFSRSIDGESRT
ncbi:uncharacterized protein LOC113527299 isoform X2 [Pangasianodon hypophthalmus]|uniref:uncharacterized protein LOC113527299 isoform X2 n=1 Tax=Pangasianodon hypophthalmus TaxID=310915 RepID=UPI002307ECF4|nr:uncharacterized protein LOC113527299 isoform X2 [Pangasianodon hypophthalmus]